MPTYYHSLKAAASAYLASFTTYPKDQQALARRAFYGGASAVLDRYVAHPDARAALVDEVQTYGVIQVFDITAPPPAGPVLQAWQAFCADGRFATPWDVVLTDLYRAIFYTGGLSALGAIIHHHVKPSLLQKEAHVQLLASRQVRATTVVADPEPGPGTFTEVWKMFTETLLKGFEPRHEALIRRVFYAGARKIYGLRDQNVDAIDQVVDEIAAVTAYHYFELTRPPTPGVFAETWRELEASLADELPSFYLVRDHLKTQYHVGAMALIVRGRDTSLAELNSVLN